LTNTLYLYLISNAFFMLNMLFFCVQFLKVLINEISENPMDTRVDIFRKNESV
jgi:hypothetical protein